MLVVGVVGIRLVLTGDYAAFVQQRMRWPLAIAALMAVGLAVVDLVAWARADDAPGPDSAPRVASLLVAPVCALLAVAPAALGASAANRVDPYEPPASQKSWEVGEEDPLPMRVIDFVDHALHDPDQQLVGRDVELEGMVVNDPAVTDGFMLVRFVVSCCAADGVPLKVILHGTQSDLADDTWVRAVVSQRPVPPREPSEVGPRIVEADLVAVQVMPNAPDSPYESPF